MKRMMFLKRMVAMMAMVFSVAMFAACSDDDETGGGDSTVAVTGITVEPNTLSLIIGDTDTLVATITPATATDSIVAWSSSDATIASVDNNGVVTALKAGSATITATSNGGAEGAAVTGTCEVTVSPLPGIGDIFYADGTYGAYDAMKAEQAVGVVFYLGDVTDVNPSLKEMFPNGTKGLVLSATNNQFGEYNAEAQMFSGITWSNTFGNYAFGLLPDPNDYTAVPEHVLLNWIKEYYTDADMLNQEVFNGYENTCGLYAWNTYSEENNIEAYDGWESYNPVRLLVLDDLDVYRSEAVVEGRTVSPWYILSIAEWQQIADNLTLINEKLAEINPDAVVNTTFSYSGLQKYWSSTLADEESGYTNDCTYVFDFNQWGEGVMMPAPDGWSPYSIKYAFAF